MTRYQLLLLPTLAAAVFVIGGALNPKPPASQAASLPLVGLESDPEALAILDQATAALSPDRVAWLETKVWQQVMCEDFTYQACGRMLTAPGNRSRFDLNVRVGNTVGELRLVNDGKAVWQSLRVGGDPPAVQCNDLPVANETLKTPAEVALARLNLLQTKGLAGLAPMLRTVRERGQGAQVSRATWQGHEVHIVIATWPDTAAVPGSAETLPPRFQVRQCRVYLDVVTGWPHRVEWWGGDKPGHVNQLLTQTEYRNGVVNQAMTEERAAGEFTFAN